MVHRRDSLSRYCDLQHVALLPRKQPREERYSRLPELKSLHC